MKHNKHNKSLLMIMKCQTNSVYKKKIKKQTFVSMTYHSHINSLSE